QTQDVHKFSALTIATSYAPTAGSATLFTVTFKGAGGAPLANAAVTLTINGTTFNLLTNGNGVATWSYTFAAAGTYTVTAAFATDGVYNDAFASISVLVKAKVTGRLV